MCSFLLQKLKTKKQLIKHYSSIIKKITSISDRDFYLEKCNNKYTCFILDKVKQIKNNNYTYSEGEVHHIIPKAVGGTDATWNLIKFSYTDHFLAHKFRYEVYNEYIDALFLRLRTKQTAEKHKLLVEASHISQKLSKSGFFNSTLQACNGKKGGAKQTTKKRLQYANKQCISVNYAFTQYMCWTHIPSNTNVYIQPKELLIVKDLYIKLHSKLPFSNSNTTTITSGLARVIKKQRKSFCGWVFIFLM